jgi:hypothetical protein
LPRRAQITFLQASLALPLIVGSLRFRGFRWTQAMLARFLPGPREASPRTAAEMASDAARTARMVSAAVRYGYGPRTCLEKSLTLWWLLSRQGIACHVRIGARKSSGRLEAHAWVEFGEVALDEPDLFQLRYAAFDAVFPPKRAESIIS